MFLPSRGGVSLRFSYLGATYEGMPLEKRKAYFSLFFIDLQHLPISYRTFFYKRSEFSSKAALSIECAAVSPRVRFAVKAIEAPPIVIKSQQ